MIKSGFVKYSTKISGVIPLQRKVAGDGSETIFGTLLDCKLFVKIIDVRENSNRIRLKLKLFALKLFKFQFKRFGKIYS